MTGKRFILYEHKDNDYILDNPNVHLDFIEMLGDALTSEEIVDKLNELHEEKEELELFKKLVYLVLKKEYDLRMNEMNILAEKEDWQGYRATKLERGTAQRIAKRLGVDLE